MPFSCTKTLSAAVLSLAFALPASAQQVQVDQSFGGSEFNWSGTGSILIRYRPIIVEGEIFVCGVYAFQGGATKARLAAAVMRDAQAKVNGQTILRNLSGFSSVSPQFYAASLDGQAANCIGSGDAGTTADLATFEMVFRSGKYRVRR